MTRSDSRAVRVGLFLPALHGGGAERVTLNLARGLAEHGHDVELVLASAVGEYMERIPAGVELVDLGAKRTLTALPALVAYLRRRPPAALLSGLNHANVIALWAARIARYRGRVVVGEHNHVRLGYDLTGRVLASSMRTTYPWAARVVAVSQGVKDSLVARTGLPVDSVSVIYNPVITPEVREAMRQESHHEFFGRPPVIVGVGRLTRQKNFANLLHAFAQVRRSRDARLVLLGDGEERTRLQELVAELGLEDHVSMPGFVANPYAFLSRANLFVLSSDWEGLPTVLIEALAAGTRVVATDCPSGPREILSAGRYGTLVPPGDSAALGHAMERALDDEAPEVTSEWLEQFTVDHATRAYEEAMGLASGGAARDDG